MKNVFEIWNDNNEQLPFFVRRHSWGKNSKFLVTEIEIKEEYYKKTGKLYGVAKGFFYRRGDKEGFQGLNCAGCYQWDKVSDND